MSKKKSFSGNTMTLKDFHGGTIPSELPLPSAPGVIIRPVDTQRPASSSSRSDHSRILRPGSSSGLSTTRPSSHNIHLDDNKTPFLATTGLPIGRHFDEDERSLGGPRSRPTPTSLSDDVALSGGPIRSNFNYNNNNNNNNNNYNNNNNSNNNCGSYSARVSQRPGSGGTHQSSTHYYNNNNNNSNINSIVGHQSSENVWGVRREREERENVVAKFAQASAIDKVASGRWQTRPVGVVGGGGGGGVDVEVIRPAEGEREVYGESGGNATLVRGEEGGRGGKEGGERVGTPEGVERPRLKLLPRTKPVESPEPSPVVENKQVGVTYLHVPLLIDVLG